MFGCYAFNYAALKVGQNISHFTELNDYGRIQLMKYPLQHRQLQESPLF